MGKSHFKIIQLGRNGLIAAVGILLLTPCLAARADDVAQYCAYLDSSAQPKGSSTNGNAKDGLCDALSTAIKVNPALEALRLGIEASDGQLMQASLRPNPSLDTELENFAGSGAARGMDSAEVTVSWNQPIELGGKRGRREEVARSEKQVAQVEFEIKRAEIIQEVKLAYIEVLSAKENLALVERRKTLAEESVSAARRRASAGGGSAVEEIKTKLALTTSRIALEQARRDLASAERKLTTFLGGTPMNVTLGSQLERTSPPPTWESLAAALPQSLDIRKSKYETSRRRASALLEEAKASSDIAVSGGVKHARDSGDTGFFVGLSVPLPLSDRNQGSILEAQKKLAASASEEKGEAARAEAVLKDAYQQMSAAYELSTSFKAEVLQSVEQGLDASNKAYRLGRLSYLEVIDAQRTLFDAREEYIKALAAYHAARALVERLLGQGFEQLTGAK